MSLTFKEKYHYHGAPCKNCQGTVRYKSTRGCAVCQNRKINAERAEKRSLHTVKSATPINKAWV